MEPGLLLCRGEEENFFLLMVQPPRRVAPADIPPREYIFIMDVSGSMYGFPLDRSKQVLRQIIGGLRPQDAFNVVLFAGDSATLAPESVPGTPDNVRKALALIDSQRGGGGTELLPALETALALPRAEKSARSVVILTDGYVDVEKEAFDLIRRNLGQANLFAFGIGTSVNRYLIEGMARAGAGEPFVVTSEEDAEATVARFTRYIGTPALTQIRLSFDRFEAYDVEPLQVPDVLAERPVVVFGKWRGEPRGAIRLAGFTGTERYDVAVPVDPAEADPENAALRYLWARHRLAVLADEQGVAPTEERVGRITGLGLRYNLLTEYTSFVAVEHVVRHQTGDLATVKQPLPMPEGVSDLAVGGSEIPEVRMNRRLLTWIVPAALLAACWPVGRWYALRMVDGGDDAWGLLALATLAAIQAARRRRATGPEAAGAADRGQVPAGVVALLAAYAVAFVFVPPLVRAGIAVAAAGCLLHDRRWGGPLPAGGWGLLMLGLPLLASLQYYLGYPLRVLAARLTVPLLGMTGIQAAAQGTGLLWRGELVLVDAPCSGLRMLWAGLYLALA
ncbi:MAG: von Willebrand factor type like domain, partial [Gemmatimonadetes bacterium]|nr:von Willebrand factor type like domain [Gemmatimonadota bacterium]